MTILAFDTTTGLCSVALLHEGNSYHAEGEQPSSQAEKLFFLIQAVLDQAGISYQQLESIAVTTGPGSFTGVRIGLAAAKGIALAAAIPLIGIGSLEAIALEAVLSNNQHPVLATLDARRGQIYAQYFDKEGIATKPALLLNYADVAAYAGDAPCIVAGNATPLIAHLLPASLPLPHITIPRASIVVLAARRKIPANSNLDAFYIREPDAKIKNAPL